MSQDTRSLVSTNLHAHDSHQRPSQRFHTLVCMFVTSTANMSTGVATKHLLTVRAWTPGQHPTTLDCCMTQTKQSVSPHSDGMSAPTRICPLRVSARTTDCQTDMFLESSCGHNQGCGRGSAKILLLLLPHRLFDLKSKLAKKFCPCPNVD